MHPLLPFRLVAAGLVLLAIAPVVRLGPELLASPTGVLMLLLELAFLGLAAKLLWQGVRWVAWALAVFQLPGLLMNGAILIPGIGKAFSFDVWPFTASIAILALLALGLWTTRPDPHDDLALFDEKS